MKFSSTKRKLNFYALSDVESISIKSSFVCRPSERSWTYKCVNGRCLRHPYTRGHSDEKRVTFMTCSNVCSSPNIWPQPTIRAHIGSNYKSFQLQDVAYSVQTNFRSVENLMVGAIAIFLDELKQMSIANGAKFPEQTTTSKQSKSSEKNSVEENVISHQRRNLPSVKISVYILKSAEIHLTMKTDECYNMTITSN